MRASPHVRARRECGSQESTAKDDEEIRDVGTDTTTTAHHSIIQLPSTQRYCNTTTASRDTRHS